MPGETRKVDFSGSILNPLGTANPSGSTGLLNLLPPPTDARLAPGVKLDPADTITSGGVDPVVQRIVRNHEGAPRTAELVAKRLLDVYGPFTAQNTQARRDAIIANLTWIAGTGVAYDTPRSEGTDWSTQSPNDTLSKGTGVCRDTHAAIAAIISSLANAQQSADGWQPGTPSNDGVRCIGFSNPKENHAYAVYRDPATGRWNAIEYSVHYNLQAASDIDAFAMLPNYVAAFRRYLLNGWNGKPSIAERGYAEGARAREFFRDDVGVGQPGEVRVTGGEREIKAAAFITKNLAVVGAFDPKAAGTSFRGGAKLNYHLDFNTKNAAGYVHAAAGAYRESFDASDTGRRAASDRQRSNQLILGAQADAALAGNVNLIGEHLRLGYSTHADLFLGVPINSGAGETGVTPEGIDQYSDAKLGAAVGFAGRESFTPELRFDWALQYRHQIDFMAAGANISMSGADHLPEALGLNTGRLSAAAALSYQKDDGTRFRVEAGANRTLAPTFAAPFSTGDHYLTVGAATKREVLSGAVMLRGQQGPDTGFVPVSSVGGVVAVKPKDWLTLGAGVDVRAPMDKREGPAVNVMGTATIRF